MIEKENASSLSIKEQCSLLEIARSTYYKTGKSESKENILLMRRMDELHTDNPTWGSRKLRDKLRLEGHIVNRKRVQRLMGVMGLQTIYQKPNLSRLQPGSKVYPYLLRGLNIERPDHVWSTDITYIRLSGGFVYLTAVIDWYSRKILSWELSSSLDNSFCISATQRALRLNGNPEIFNTDQGVQYTSKDFQDVFKDTKVKISMDGKGRAIDNVRIERFWRTIKYDEVYLKDYADMEEAKREIGSFIRKYNEERPHEKLNGLTPATIYDSII